ncbi:MAG: serine protease, partial [Alphaproteobacteria bacterium]
MTMRPSLVPCLLRRCAASLAAVLVVTGGPVATAGGLSETIKRVKPAIVGVGSYQHTRRPPALLLGTGFVVG